MKKLEIVKNLNILKNRLTSGSITIYEAVDKVLESEAVYLPMLKKDLTTHKSPYFRLFAAWCIGKSSCRNCKRLLEDAYRAELNNNVRANIVWAYFRLRNENSNYLKAFINDSYFLVRLTAIKNISRNYKFLDLALFLKLTNQDEHEIVRIETIRKTHFFSDEERAVSKQLSRSLSISKSLVEIDSLIQAIGLIRDNSSLGVITNFYKKNKNLFFAHPELTLSLCKAINTNDESSAYNVLFDIYKSSRQTMIKYQVIETLSVCGGPNSYEVLSNITKIEKNKEVRKFAIKLQSCVELTLP